MNGGNSSKSIISYCSYLDLSENNYNQHFFCTQCHKFPFIKFCKDRKNIKLTCSCFNNKNFSIKELFTLMSNKDNNSIFLPSETNLNIDIREELICKKHNKKFKGFSKFFLNNYCEDCDNYKDEFDDNDIIKFVDIKIEEKKIEELIKKINGDVSKKMSDYNPDEYVLFLLYE